MKQAAVLLALIAASCEPQFTTEGEVRPLYLLTNPLCIAMCPGTTAVTGSLVEEGGGSVSQSTTTSQQGGAP